jgi:hypothetical protein
MRDKMSNERRSRSLSDTRASVPPPTSTGRSAWKWTVPSRIVWMSGTSLRSKMYVADIAPDTKIAEGGDYSFDQGIWRETDRDVFEPLSPEKTSQATAPNWTRKAPSSPRVQTRKQVQTRLTCLQIEDLASAYQSGRPTYELATEFSIRRLTVFEILIREGVPRRTLHSHQNQSRKLLTSTVQGYLSQSWRIVADAIPARCALLSSRPRNPEETHTVG